MEMSVGQVAKRAGVKVSTLHFYEQKGLIASWRNAGNQRRYDRAVLRRLAVIKAAQHVGLSLEEIGEALSELPSHRAPTKEQWRDMAQRWDATLNEQIARLQQLQANLSGCIGCGCLSMKTCSLYNPNDVVGEVTQDDNVLNHPKMGVTQLLKDWGKRR
ncbi:redox-sensitive transcriptional activator SoxR [Salinivibrio kushneri]|uniref:Redox-sensitive transcriptional activator SoxR n=1 Tax=Salinivibrio kushneri TaxID=1908198 RepID=A0AB36JZF4_9GAMM|nr:MULTISPECIES: redox-sensitive transcriptional activator SoxR [Salinivibrio]ODP99389.1 redox-sensitive transcriptional activator SoxR [Salinivibrio sp. BNH]OOE35413.1 redox-sensitive transcriptional activator SoxR [Salinivibrio kushneri]OOE40633.1 redox-sensitive transcriptional activator SoxR [Salinivibrio kushneri]QCP03682.1 redox-sensitive transcriptional activator SoxR [Salinivibrio kushneri]WBA19453.1 redox-sensitive transcriptional activator SoxR [Salinivibrio kushneri]